MMRDLEYSSDTPKPEQWYLRTLELLVESLLLVVVLLVFIRFIVGFNEDDTKIRKYKTRKVRLLDIRRIEDIW